jgi:tryptophan synthase beta chain
MAATTTTAASITTAAAASTAATITKSQSSSFLKPYSSSQLPFKFSKFTASRAPSRLAISCTLAREAVVKMEDVVDSDPAQWQRPDSFGRFGKFGGKYVPETLIHALTELESAFHSLKDDPEFKVSLPTYTYIGLSLYIAFVGLLKLSGKECLFHFRCLLCI